MGNSICTCDEKSADSGANLIMKQKKRRPGPHMQNDSRSSMMVPVMLTPTRKSYIASPPQSSSAKDYKNLQKSLAATESN